MAAVMCYSGPARHSQCWHAGQPEVPVSVGLFTKNRKGNCKMLELLGKLRRHISVKLKVIASYNSNTLAGAQYFIC